MVATSSPSYTLFFLFPSPPEARDNLEFTVKSQNIKMNLDKGNEWISIKEANQGAAKLKQYPPNNRHILPYTPWLLSWIDGPYNRNQRSTNSVSSEPQGWRLGLREQSPSWRKSAAFLYWWRFRLIVLYMIFRIRFITVFAWFNYNWMLALRTVSNAIVSVCQLFPSVGVLFAQTKHLSFLCFPTCPGALLECNVSTSWCPSVPCWPVPFLNTGQNSWCLYVEFCTSSRNIRHVWNVDGP